MNSFLLYATLSGATVFTIKGLYLLQAKIDNVGNKSQIIDIATVIGITTLVGIVVKLTTTVNGIETNQKLADLALEKRLGDDILKNRQAILELANKLDLTILTATHSKESLGKDITIYKEHYEKNNIENNRRLTSLENWSTKQGFQKRNRDEILE